MTLDRHLQRLWYQRKPFWLLVLLSPLSVLFAGVVACRRAAYRYGLLRCVRVARPVIVVGNISVGGTGKTPLVIWLAEQLQSRGKRAGIILRGYGGRAAQWPLDVNPDTSVAEAGDEAVLLAERTGAIVVAGPDRVAAARRAIDLGADVVLSDDGLQHYRLARDCEIAVIDAERGLGNGWLLPAGPLREPASRLRSVALVVRNQRPSAPPEDAAAASSSAGAAGKEDNGVFDRLGNAMRTPHRITIRARLVQAIALVSGEIRPLESFRGAQVHAVAGIGNPQSFFDALRLAGLRVHARALSDHAAFSQAELEFGDQAPVLMTEKDAVKCRSRADTRHWAVRLAIEVDAADTARVVTLLDDVLRSDRQNR